MLNAPLRIATRGSPLALWQARFVAERLAPRSVELVLVKTTGDRDLNTSLSVLGGQGVFTKEVQRAVLERRADVAVHSLKDLPTAAAPGLTLAAVPKRGPAGDAFVSAQWPGFDQLPKNARVATGSLRRQAQLKHRRPDLKLIDIRGNVDSRLKHLDVGRLDALILAEAGLDRLGYSDRITERLGWMIPAVGQGALGLECRDGDADTIAVLERLNDAATAAEVRAERSLLFHLGGGCQVPLGASARCHDGRLELIAVVLSADGRGRITDSHAAPVADAESLGAALAERLRAAGADQWLNRNVGEFVP